MSSEALDKYTDTLYCTEHESRYEYNDGLTCIKGGESIRIAAGIPRFVPETNYANAFGEQWKKYRLTQLDSHSGVPITRDRIRRCLGESLWGDLKNKVILEAGCGAGRFTEILLAEGATVVSVDLSDAVEANQENFPINDKHLIAQADIGNLPFPPKSFDIVLCLGVVQHTPNSVKTISDLYKHVKEGGSLVIDHYALTLARYTKIAPILRQYLKRLPPGKAFGKIETLVNIFLPWHKRFKKNRLANTLLNRISPLNSYYHKLPELNDEQQREWALLDTHDTLTDWHRRYKTKEQMRRILAKLGMEDIYSENGGNGVESRGIRPNN